MNSAWKRSCWSLYREDMKTINDSSIPITSIALDDADLIEVKTTDWIKVKGAD